MGERRWENILEVCRSRLGGCLESWNMDSSILIAIALLRLTVFYIWVSSPQSLTSSTSVQTQADLSLT